jgi:hypothetical protein
MNGYANGAEVDPFPHLFLALLLFDGRVIYLDLNSRTKAIL